MLITLRDKMKSKHKFYRCTSLRKAGVQFLVSCVLTWFAVGLATEEALPSRWSPEVKVMAFVISVIFSAVVFTNDLREDKEGN